MITVWLIWVQDDGYTWLEGAWSDDATADNPHGWVEEVDRVRKLAYENKYEMRIQRATIPGVFQLFEIPGVTAS